jgi:hypothetical protein
MTKRYLTSLFEMHPVIGLVDLSWIGIISISETMPRSAQKSSISWVSAMPPISEPAIDRRPSFKISSHCRRWARDAGMLGHADQAQGAVALQQGRNVGEGVEIVAGGSRRPC